MTDSELRPRFWFRARGWGEDRGWYGDEDNEPIGFVRYPLSFRKVGWSPITWQGWLLVGGNGVILIASFVALFFAAAGEVDFGARIALYVCLAGLSYAVLVWIAWRKGEPLPRAIEQYAARLNECVACHTDNPPEALYCRKCGRRLPPPAERRNWDEPSAAP